MPSVEELKRWLAGEEVEGLPSDDRPKPRQPSPESKKIPKRLPDGRYRCEACQGEGKISEAKPGGKWELFDCPECEGEGAVEGRPLTDEMREKAEEVARRRGIRGGKYSISVDGKDAVLMFGKYSGQPVSALAQDSDGAGYLRWMMKQEFAPELLDVVSYWLSLIDTGRR